MHLYERLSPRFRPKRELGPRGSGTGRGARHGRRGTAGLEAHGRHHVGAARGPKLVSSAQHDTSSAPIERGLHLPSGIDLDEVFSEVRSPAPGVITPDHEPSPPESSSAGRSPWRSKRIRRRPNRIEEPIRVPPEDARGAVLASG